MRQSTGLLAITVGLLLAHLSGAASPRTAGKTSLPPTPLAPVWQFEVPAVPDTHVSSWTRVTFPQPRITKNEFLKQTPDKRFPLKSVALSRYILGGGREVMPMLVVSIVPINPDGTFAGPPSPPVRAVSIGLPVSGCPCVVAAADSAPHGTLRVWNPQDGGVPFKPPPRHVSVHYASEVEIAAMSFEQATPPFEVTRFLAFDTGRILERPGMCFAAAANRRAGLAAFLLASRFSGQVPELVVLDRSGSPVLRQGLQNCVPTLAVRRGWVLVGRAVPPDQQDIAVRLPAGTHYKIPGLPAGGRAFSGDGTHLLIWETRTTPTVLHYYDLNNPLAPAHLWSRTMPDSVPAVSCVAVSPSGRRVAYQLMAVHSCKVVLVVVSHDGRELGSVTHCDPHIVDGLAFADDRYLLEGVYRGHGTTPPTRTGRLYDLGGGDRPQSR